MPNVKQGIAVLGVDDVPFTKDDETTTVIGTVYRGADRLEAVLSQPLTVDGMDATEAVTTMAAQSRQQQIQAVLLDGITFGGFNIVDIQQLHSDTATPVIAFNRNRPDLERIYDALENLEKTDERRQCIDQAGAFHEITVNGTQAYIQVAGIDAATAEDIITTSSKEASLPEPLRAAHLIGKGIADGESRGT